MAKPVRHLAYQKLPAPNAILEAKEQAKERKRMEARIKQIMAREPGSSTVDNKEPRTMRLPHLARNLKREQTAHDRALEMARDNQRILSKMTGVTSSFTPEFYERKPGPVSMNRSRRKAELERINAENKRLLKALDEKHKMGSMSHELDPPVTLNMGSVKHKLPKRGRAMKVPPTGLSQPSFASSAGAAASRAPPTATPASSLMSIIGADENKLLAQLARARPVLGARRLSDGTRPASLDAEALEGATASAPDLHTTVPPLTKKRRKKRGRKRRRATRPLDLAHHPLSASVSELAAAAGAIPYRRLPHKRSVSPKPRHTRSMSPPAELWLPSDSEDLEATAARLQALARNQLAAEEAAAEAAAVDEDGDEGAAEEAAATRIQAQARRRAASRRVSALQESKLKEEEGKEEGKEGKDDDDDDSLFSSLGSDGDSVGGGKEGEEDKEADMETKDTKEEADHAEEAAAVKIQAIQRRRLATKRVNSMKRRRDAPPSTLGSEEEEAAVKIQAIQRRRLATRRVNSMKRRRGAPPPTVDKDEEEAAVKIQAIQRRRLATKRVNSMKRRRDGPPPASYGKDEEEAAVRIQAVQRRRLAARRVKSMRREPSHRQELLASVKSAYGTTQEDAAATKIQAAARRRHAARRVNSMKAKRHVASPSRPAIDADIGTVVTAVERDFDGTMAVVTVTHDAGLDTLCATATIDGAEVMCGVPAAVAAEDVPPAVIALLAFEGEGAVGDKWLQGHPTLTTSLKARLLALGVRRSVAASAAGASPTRPSTGLVYRPPTVATASQVVRVGGELVYAKCALVASSEASKWGSGASPATVAVLSFTRRWDGSCGTLFLGPPEWVAGDTDAPKAVLASVVPSLGLSGPGEPFKVSVRG